MKILLRKFQKQSTKIEVKRQDSRHMQTNSRLNLKVFQSRNNFDEFFFQFQSKNMQSSSFEHAFQEN
jgi:hypothetical protein